MKPGDMLYGWAEDQKIRGQGRSGGVVTALLQHALREKLVDVVFTVRKGADVYDAEFMATSDPDEVAASSGSVYCGTLLLSTWIYQYIKIHPGTRIAAPVKGCDMKALIELSKRKLVDLNDLLLIGLSCSGTIRPKTARRVVSEVLHEDPDEIEDIWIAGGQLIAATDRSKKGVTLEKLESMNLGRRANCQRCMTRIPRQCDLVCGEWGVLGEYIGSTFIEICSRKGSNFLESAKKNVVIGISPADPRGIELRSRVEESMVSLSKQSQEEQFGMMGDAESRLDWIMKESARCIKCYQCTEACPLCTCDDCRTKKPWLVKPGQVPPPFMFHLIRISHIADSCVNCGQCEDRCPMDIKNSLIMNSLQSELEQMFGYHPGEKKGMPVVAKINQHDEWEHHYEENFEKRVEMFRKKSDIF